MNKENEKELRKHLELQTKEELIEQIIIQTRTYENALNIITDKKEIINKAIEYIEERKKYKGEPFYLDEMQTEILYEILRGKDNE